jgi:5-methylcytosine-specific restriction enzyme B
MSIEALVEIIHDPNGSWSDRNKEAFKDLFGSAGGRYPQNASKTVTVRAPEMEEGVRFAAYINPANPTSGPYGGFSFVIFPVEGQPCLVGLGVGTQGLAPDEVVLGRPGHARKTQAIAAWLNQKHGKGNQIAWAKSDPTRTDIVVPTDLQHKWSHYKSVFDRYGKEMYLLFTPIEKNVTREAVTALLDLMFEERGFLPLAGQMDERNKLRSHWFDYLMPKLTRDNVKTLLNDRRFVVIQGPPGTGKTTMALALLSEDYAGNGITVQFHPNTTYEGFVGGLAPVQSGTDLGLRFDAQPGFLMRAVVEARKNPRNAFLLVIDEINRADLGKILGEAIFLFEPDSATKRAVALQYKFEKPIESTLALPENLHVLGTMNTADRSIALVDVAVRRRFAFASLWPDAEVVKGKGCELMQRAFEDLTLMFLEHAPEEAFNLLPGHSYFLEPADTKARRRLRSTLAPLLEEYLAQGYVAGFAEPIRNYLQWLRSL